MNSITRLCLTLTIVGFFCSWTKIPNDDCKILHEGTFKYADLPQEIIVKINGTKHVEFHNDGKYVIESRLEWRNDCEYNMTMTRVTIPNFPYGPGDVMNVKIEKVIGNEIYFTCSVKNQSWKGKFIKMKK